LVEDLEDLSPVKSVWHVGLKCEEMRDRLDVELNVGGVDGA